MSDDSYEHPLSELYPEDVSQPGLGAGYEPPGPRARWVVRLLVVAAVVDVLAVLSGLAERSLLGQDVITPSEADANDDRQAVVGLVQIVVLVVTAVVFIRWLHRAYRNLPEVGARDLRFKPGWAIGSWFVPILNLWRPKQIANDVWRASDPALRADAGSEWRTHTVPQFLNVWWGAFLVSNWVGQIGFRLSRGADTLSELRHANSAYLVLDSVDLVAAVLAILVVRRLTARQERRAGALSANEL